jgi:hypothetical protein
MKNPGPRDRGTIAGRVTIAGRKEHHQEKWEPVFPWDKREAFAQR